MLQEIEYRSIEASPARGYTRNPLITQAQTRKREATKAFNSGLREQKRMDKYAIGGIKASEWEKAPELVRDLVQYLWKFLHAKLPSNRVKRLLKERIPGGCSGSQHEPETGVELACDLLNSIFGALRWKDRRSETLLFGRRDAARQAGTRKPRQPKINEWIEKQLKRDATATAPDLWANFPQSFENDVGYERFRKRVGQVRKSLGLGRKQLATQSSRSIHR